MVGLMIKDGCALLKQTKLFMLLAAIMAVLQSDFIFGYSIFYAAMLPVTAIAYDEKSKWNKYADMLPYSTGQIVGSKYLIGYACATVFALLALGSKALVWGITSEDVSAILFVLCMGLSVMALNLPISFGLGVEKGRMLFVLLTVVTLVTVIECLQDMDISRIDISMKLVLVIGCFAAILINWISFQISKKLYKRESRQE